MAKKFTILSLMLLVFTTCQKDHIFDCFKSTGKTITVERTATPFENINLTNNVDLVIRPDTIFYIKVTAGDNLVDGIITELDGNTLYIRNENRCNWVRSFKNTYTVEVGMDKLVKIFYDGSGDVSCVDSISTDEFFFECFNGSGTINLLLNCRHSHLNNHIGRADFHVKGFCAQSEIYINDVGTMDASELVTEDTYVRNSSTGNIRVNAHLGLGYEILSIGNIYYTGNPQITSSLVTGSGKLIAY